jgi:RNA polymerase sigma-70 factor (ECF subfamily)
MFSGSGKVQGMFTEELKDLVIRAQTGDKRAYGELVRQFQPTVYAVALARLRNPSEAEELAQTVFVRVMDKLGQLRDVACFPGWLRRITERLAINRLTRGAPVHGSDQEMLEAVPAATDTPLEQMVRTEDQTAVWDGLQRLKRMDRETLVAFYIHGQSLQEMSADFETPIGTIKRRLHVARNRLRKHLERGGRPRPDAIPRRRQRELALCR